MPTLAACRRYLLRGYEVLSLLLAPVFDSDGRVIGLVELVNKEDRTRAPGNGLRRFNSARRPRWRRAAPRLRLTPPQRVALPHLPPAHLVRSAICCREPRRVSRPRAVADPILRRPGAWLHRGRRTAATHALYALLYLPPAPRHG